MRDYGTLFKKFLTVNYRNMGCIGTIRITGQRVSKLHLLIMLVVTNLLQMFKFIYEIQIP